MDKEHILITKISIREPILSSQLYSGRLYIWTVDQQLHIYSWKKCLALLQQIDRPIYLEPFPSEQLDLSLAALEPALIRSRLINETITDTAIFNHVLYMTAAEGLYRLPLNQKEAIPEQISSIPMEHLYISRLGRMVCTSKQEGVFEYLLTTRYFYPDQQAKVANRLYQIQTDHTQKVAWDAQNLIQWTDGVSPKMYYLTFAIHKGAIHFLKAKEIIDAPVKENDADRIQPLPLHLSLTEPLEGDGQLFSFEEQGSQKIKVHDDYQDPFVKIRSFPSPLSQQTAVDFERFFYLDEQKDLLSLYMQDECLLSLPKESIEKWKIFDRTFDYQNQLHVITAHTLDLYLFTQISR